MFWREIKHVVEKNWSDMSEFTVLVVRVTSEKCKTKAKNIVEYF